jgi:hypothetical protein
MMGAGGEPLTGMAGAQPPASSSPNPECSNVQFLALALAHRKTEWIPDAVVPVDDR